MANFHISPATIPPLMLLLLVPPGYYYYNNWNSIGHSRPCIPCKLRPNFPPHIPINFTEYRNWVGEIRKDSWIAYPENPHQILELTNWARVHGFKIRPSGSRHSWAPLTIQGKNDYPSEMVLIVDTANLNRMAVISTKIGNSFFWAETGIKFYDLLTKLEENTLGIGSFPNVKGPSLGGILAIGGRGVGSYGANETSPPDHSFGSVSNLIISLTAIVYNPILDSYVLQEFHRSNPDAKAFLVHLGRAFITNVTMRAGPLLNYTLQSRVDLNPEILFASPGPADANSTTQSENNSFASQLKNYHRVAVSYFEMQGLLWLKTWKTSPTKPESAVEIKDPKQISENMFENHEFWGTSKNTLIVIGEDAAPLSLAGWAVITNHGNTQKVVHEFYQIFKNILQQHQQRSQNNSTLNVGLEIRTAELDHAGDVNIPGAESPGLGTLQPLPDRPDFNIAIYLNVLSADIITGPKGQAPLEFINEVEHAVLHHFDTDWSVVRMEWSKSWALTENANVFDESLIHNLKNLGRFTHAWDYSVATLNNYDPFGVFTNKLLDDLFLGNHGHPAYNNYFYSSVH